MAGTMIDRQWFIDLMQRHKCKPLTRKQLSASALCSACRMKSLGRISAR